MKEKYFQYMYLTKKLYLEYMKNPYNSRRKPDFENKQKIWTHALQKKICKWLISTWKDGQNHLVIKEVQIKTTKRHHYRVEI